MPRIREMRETDDELTRVDELLMLAYEMPSRRAEVEVYVRAAPTRWSVIEDNGTLLAVAGCLNYGDVAWLGLVATHPDARGQGLASQISQHLVEWAHGLGCTIVALDASDSGRPVYARLGFEHVGWTVELLRPDGLAVGSRLPASAPDLDEIIAFDRAAFGSDRSGLFGALADGDWHVTRTADGALAGYLLSRGPRLGPAAAIDEASARILLASALETSTEQRLLVPHGSAYLETVLDLGFVEQRRLAHMRLGGVALPASRGRLIAQLSYATG